MGNRVITVYAVGRKSGRHYAIPVAYTRHDGILLIGTPFVWGRNLHTGEPVDIRFKGKRRPTDVHVLTDEACVLELYAVLARDNHHFAKSTRSVSTPQTTRTPTTFTWPGPRAPEPSG